MLRSLFSGVSGMKNQQTKMDVIGNNIANANTTAFKASRVTFKDMLSQTVQSASSPTTSTGGTNPKQVGLGMAVASIDTDMSQGALQPTGRATDLAIQGDGFLIVKRGNEKYYTRDGSLTLDKNGDLLTSEGLHVYGENKQDPSLDYINIPVEHDIVPPISLKVGTDEVFKIKIYGFDGTGIATVKISNAAQPQSNITKNGTAVKEMITFNATTKDLTINTHGITNLTDLEKEVNKYLSMIANADETQMDSTTSNALAIRNSLINGEGISGISITGDLSKITTATPTAGTAAATGTPAVSPDIKTERVKLTSFGIEKDGSIKGIYGEDVFEVGKIKIASFQNPMGLEKVGGNLYRQTSNSGAAQEGYPAEEGFGTIEQGNLEMSKVDLANEFTEMIITSRAFQANSKTITTSDEMLQELLNLKR
jgi:flagellar hook protein FlgE